MTYQFQEFPKWIYSEIRKELIIVKDAIEEAFHRTPVSPPAPTPNAGVAGATPVHAQETLLEAVHPSGGLGATPGISVRKIEIR